MNITDKLFKKTLAWIHDFNMIKNWDRVIAAISWWKDSLAMLDLLVKLQKHSPFKFELIAVYVVPQVPWILHLWEKLKEIFEWYWIDYVIKEMQIPAESKLKEWIEELKSCQWCSFTRRITLFKLAEELKATKIAYGHHKDDIVHTFFMNVNASRRLKIMPCVNRMKKWDFRLIRPMVYIREQEVINYCSRNNIIPLSAQCPLAKVWWREKMKNIVHTLEEQLPDFVDNLFDAYIKKIGIEWY